MSEWPTQLKELQHALVILGSLIGGIRPAQSDLLLFIWRLGRPRDPHARAVIGLVVLVVLLALVDIRQALQEDMVSFSLRLARSNASPSQVWPTLGAPTA